MNVVLRHWHALRQRQLSWMSFEHDRACWRETLCPRTSERAPQRFDNDMTETHFTDILSLSALHSTDSKKTGHRRRWCVLIHTPNHCTFPFLTSLYLSFSTSQSKSPSNPIPHLHIPLGACGKTSLLCCFALGEFPKEYVS